MGFFDKLKMGASAESKREEESPEKEVKQKTSKTKVKVPKKEKAAVLIQEAEPMPPKKDKAEESDFEGELAIDVYETDNDFVIRSTIAGVKAEDLDITIENDIVTIKGSREKQTSEQAKKHYYQECYWGTFSRQVILPEEVDGSKAEATMKDGVLTLRIPKIEKILKRKIAIKRED